MRNGVPNCSFLPAIGRRHQAALNLTWKKRIRAEDAPIKMPTHLSVINLSPIRARPAPSKVSATSFPMVLGRDARAQALGRRCGLAPAPPLVLPAPPVASSRLVRCPGAGPRSRCPAPPRPAAQLLVQGHLYPRESKLPLCSRFKETFTREILLFFKAQSTETGAEALG